MESQAQSSSSRNISQSAVQSLSPTKAVCQQQVMLSWPRPLLLGSLSMHRRISKIKKQYALPLPEILLASAFPPPVFGKAKASRLKPAGTTNLQSCNTFAVANALQ